MLFSGFNELISHQKLLSNGFWDVMEIYGWGTFNIWGYTRVGKKIEMYKNEHWIKNKKHNMTTVENHFHNKVMCLFLLLHFWLLSLSLTISRWKASLSFLPSFYLYQQRTMARSTSLQIAAVTLLFHEWCTVNGVVLHVSLCSPVASDTNNNEDKEPWMFLFLYFELNRGSNLISFRFFYFTARTFFLNKK